MKMCVSLAVWLEGRKTPAVTHSSLRKSKVLDFSVGNWEKVLLLFTRLPGALYFTLDGASAFFRAGGVEEEELNSLLKLQGSRARKRRRETDSSGAENVKRHFTI